MLKDVTFGQYYPTDSFLHRMDSRAKILLVILYITIIFLIDNFIGFLPILFLLTLAIVFSKVPFKSILKSIKAILFLVIFTTILNVFFYSEGNIVFSLGFIKITDKALIFSAFMALRLILLVMGTSVLTLTTTPVSLTDGIESLLKPLNLIKFPVHELALIMSIALRFIPTLMEETDRIILAQKARGANFETGSLMKRAKALLPILIPLLISAFRRADELADAMDARCYSGSQGRTKFKKLKYTLYDLTGALVCVAILFLVIYANAFFGIALT